MSTISARFNQSPVEKKRYMLDWTAQLAAGEVITGVTANVTSTTDNSPSLSFTITGIVIAPAGNQAVFFAAYGLTGNVYEVQFIATTSIGQIFEDVVVYNVQEKT